MDHDESNLNAVFNVFLAHDEIDVCDDVADVEDCAADELDESDFRLVRVKTMTIATAFFFFLLGMLTFLIFFCDLVLVLVDLFSIFVGRSRLHFSCVQFLHFTLIFQLVLILGGCAAE